MTRGDIVDVVRAVGTLQPVSTVQVGAQVSGRIAELLADHNSLVKKGQVLARLDPETVEAQIEQARASVARAQADLERQSVAAVEARKQLERAEDLWNRQLIPRAELETVRLALRTAEAQVRSSKAAVGQAQASLDQQQVNLARTVVLSPIDGLVLSRNVDVGQTVAARVEAPVLFVLAGDLTRMQVIANIDEADIGPIRPGQQVRFKVDAYPEKEFLGTVAQVRLQPVVTRGQVRYPTVVSVPNPDLKLTPGMTASIGIETARRDNVLRVPTVATLFTPTDEMFEQLGQDPMEVDVSEEGSGEDSVWVMRDGRLVPIDVELGVSNGLMAELVGGSLEAGTELVWNISDPDAAVRPPPQPRNRNVFPFRTPNRGRR